MGTSQVSLTLKLTTSYPRSRSANSAKNPLGVFQTPILLRKTVVLAVYFQNSGTPFVEEFSLSPRVKSHYVRTYYELSSLPLG